MKRSSRATYLTGESKVKNHLKSIDAKMVQYTPLNELAEFIPDIVSLTWLEEYGDINKLMYERGLDRVDIVQAMFDGKTLPTAMETIRVTMLLSGLDMTNVTHIIRHRMFGFSAQSSGWGSMEGHDMLTNDAYEEHDDLHQRAMKLIDESLELYIDALDRGLTFYDARHYLPHCIENKYYMSGNLADWIRFINTRLDRTNQPTSDNILAAKCRQQILNVYPMLRGKMPPKPILWLYINSIKSKFNVNTYPPDKEHAEVLNEMGIDYSDVVFDNDKPRDEYTCNDKFEVLFNEIVGEE